MNYKDMGKKKLKSPRKTRPYSIRFDIELEEFLDGQKNLSKLINQLVKEYISNQEDNQGKGNK